jgi:hypothetical protein
MHELRGADAWPSRAVAPHGACRSHTGRGI